MNSGVTTADSAPQASPWADAFRQVTPILMGYLPVGMAFGVLAAKSGLATYNIVLMSLLVYAGSAQLIAVSMFAAGMSPLSIVLTTFVVNLRHLLMSAALAPYLKKWKFLELAAFSFEITDESFGVHSVRFAKGETDPKTSILINCMAQAGWVIASLAGTMASAAIPDIEPLGIDYALPAMFIALLVAQTKDGLHVLIAGFTGLLSIMLFQAGLESWSVIIATVIGATLGMGVQSWNKD